MNKRLIAVVLFFLALSVVPQSLIAQTTNSNQQPTGVQSQPTPATNDTFFSRVFGIDEVPVKQEGQESWLVIVSRIIQRLALAALLAAMLAKRPRKHKSVIQLENPYMAQTHILLAVVASSLMMVVGDNAARAFGIFAAASLVRFRTNVRDPKEITILLISLAIGLATGVGRWELGVILTLFVLPLLWVLEFQEPYQVSRAMELKVRTQTLEETQKLLKEIFKRHNFNTEIRVLKPADEKDPLGLIVYYININLSVSTDQINEEILASDTGNIACIEWDQKKTTSYIYQ